MTRKRFLGVDVVRHPWLTGQLWGVLACLLFVVLQSLNGHPLSFVGLAVLFGLGVAGGVAFGAVWSIVTANERARDQAR